jgi:hypothetical protein
LTEITELVKKRDGLLHLLASQVRVALSTADAYAKFLAKQSRTSAARILREKMIDVAILDEAQAYELDQVMACIAAPGPGDNKVKTVGFAGDPNQGIISHFPRWTRAPWISDEAPRAHNSLPVEEVDMDTSVLDDAGVDGRAFIKNPEHRPFTTWLDQSKGGVLLLELNGCKRCGPQVCNFVSKLFPAYCGKLVACPEAFPTHTFYDSPWLALHEQGAEPSSAMINRVMFASLAYAIAGNLMDVVARDIALIPNHPLLVVIVYLQRHARPPRTFLESTFNRQSAQELIRFDAGCIKVLLLDSARGMTAVDVHVIRGLVVR